MRTSRRISKSIITHELQSRNPTTSQPHPSSTPGGPCVLSWQIIAADHRLSCIPCISWLKFPASAFSLADSAHQRKLAVKISVVPAFLRGKNGSVSSVASCSIRVSPSSLSSVFISVHLWLTKMVPFALLPPVQSLFVWFEYFVVKGLRMPSFVIRHSSFAFS